MDDQPHAPVSRPAGEGVDLESGEARTKVVNIVERYVTGWGGEYADNPYEAAPLLAGEILSLFRPQPTAGEGEADWKTCPICLETVGSDVATDDLVDRFAEALKAKLRAAGEKYGFDDAWKQDDWREKLIEDLYRHVQKGDPRDVAAYCAFAWYHGWSLSLGEPMGPIFFTDQNAEARYAGEGEREAAGCAEPEVGRAVYERIETLLTTDPQGWERSYLCHLVKSVEETGGYSGPQSIGGMREAVARIIKERVSGPHFTDPTLHEAMDRDRLTAADAILSLLSPAAPDAGGDELIERSLRTIHAYDAVRYLRDALSATTARLTGYDWNADPEGITRQQGDAFTAADKVFADLNAAVDAHPEIDLPECASCGGTGKIEEAAHTHGANQHSACIRTCDECDGCGFAPDDSALQPGGER